jgi:hypothetical protein
MIWWRREPQDHRVRARLAITHPQQSLGAITWSLSDFAVPVDHARHVVGVIAVGAGDDRWDE